MIKPVKIIQTVSEVAQKVSTKSTSTATDVVEEAVQNSLPAGDAALLRAYNGVRTKKLFANFADFLSDYKKKLMGFKKEIPEELYNKLSSVTSNNDFSLSRIVSEYYSGLNNCKNFDDVRKLYPEIKLPNVNFEEEIALCIKSFISEDVCKTAAKLSTSTSETKTEYLNRVIDSTISTQVEKWEICNEVQAIKKKVIQEIIDNKFKGMPNETVYDGSIYNTKYGNQKMPLRYRLMHTEDREKAIIDILKENYVNGKNLTDIKIINQDGKEIPAYNLQKKLPFSSMDKHFKQFIKSTEANAQSFKDLANLSQHEISSAIMTQSWRTSRLRVDLGNMTTYNKDWSLIKPIWQKTMFPETTFYPTDKLIDTYLLGLFKNGKRQAEISDPIAKLLDNPSLDKSKIMLLKRLYKMSKTIDMDKNILNSTAFKEFKAQFDTAGMAKSIESIEEHYKNVFFKIFWTDERKLRLSTALSQNREIAGRNIEISDKILLNALDNVFSEIG